MPIIVSCPKCGERLHVRDESAGKSLRCGKCSAVFSLPASAAAAARSASQLPASAAPPPKLDPSPPESPSLPAPPMPPAAAPPLAPVPAAAQKRASTGEDAPPLAPSWSSVRRGLACHNVGYTILFVVSVLTLLGQLGFLFLTAADSVGLSGDLGTLAQLLPFLSGLAALPGMVFVFIGDCRCCAAPRESGAKGLILGRFLCLVAGLLLTLVPALLLLSLLVLSGTAPRNSHVQVPVYLYAAGVVFLFVAHILYLLFLRKVARFFGQEKLARRVVRFFIWWLGLIVVLVLSVGAIALLLALLPREYASVLGPLLLLGWVAGSAVGIVVMFLRLLGLIRGTRDTIRKALEVRPSQPVNVTPRRSLA